MSKDKQKRVIICTEHKLTGNFISYIIDRKLGVTYMLVGIIGAMDLEVQALKGLMDNAVVETISTIDFYKGNINGVETVVAVAGSR